ncbi:retropepsin-like aspartic protease family protein [Allosphingosinicella deserti]|uniref:TIGR02281 family clan AA aspartic protease n=1 Tax=Allosphingosinicella deserti TaxID=2116704 RepID=A0A2P7QSI8_9SPHN|nr:TIGR02281 family clan AA aspartic protease [Sphingomonas deserti]PSJ40917.1 TIGR02281 family clan AA aspartic protease [Sphingomonas deserti]
MPTTITPEWQHIALYAVIAAVALILIQRIPIIGRLIRFALSFALLAFCLYLLIQQAPYQPFLAGIADKIGLDRQEVVGREVRLRMAPDGHFWANATLNGVRRRMLIDSGATITAISEETAVAAGIDGESGLVPVMMRTANGVVPARTGTIDELRLGNVVARDLKVVVSPGLGTLDVIGMNFLSKLASWRVEGRTLVLVPHNPQPTDSGESKGKR